MMNSISGEAIPSEISACISKHTKEVFGTSLEVQQWCLSTRELQLSFLGRKSIVPGNLK